MATRSHLCLNQTKCSIIFRLDLFCTSAPRCSITRDDHKKRFPTISPFCLHCRGSSLATVAALYRQPCHKCPNHRVFTWGTWLSASSHKTASLLVLINTAKISRLLVGCLHSCLGAQLTCCCWSTLPEDQVWSCLCQCVPPKFCRKQGQVVRSLAAGKAWKPLA